jgi:hypothetical protein
MKKLGLSTHLYPWRDRKYTGPRIRQDQVSNTILRLPSQLSPLQSTVEIKPKENQQSSESNLDLSKKCLF